MAVFDTYKAVKALTAAGFTETQAQTLVETVGEGRDDIATKADVATVREEVATKADLKDLEILLERRLTNLVLQLAIFQVMVGGLIVAALKLLP